MGVAVKAQPLVFLIFACAKLSVDLSLLSYVQSSNDCALLACSDVEAISTWLRARGTRSRNTFDCYRREATRLILWLNEQNLTLRSMKVEDVHAYFALLANPPAHWIKPRKSKKNSYFVPTQVMVGSLGASSLAYSRTVLGQLFSYLHDSGYVDRNVFKLSSRPPIVQLSGVSRHLDLAGWQWLWNWILKKSLIPVSSGYGRIYVAAFRVRWLFALLYHSGMRRSEVANSFMGDFIWKDNQWLLRVIGKGNKERFITVNSSLIDELKLYRANLGFLSPLPFPGERLPLVSALSKKRSSVSLSSRYIGFLVQATARAAANECEDDFIRVQLSSLSTHWLRHTHASHRLQAGASLDTTQDELGHSDPKTTRIYAKNNLDMRVSDAEKLAVFAQSSITLSK